MPGSNDDSETTVPSASASREASGLSLPREAGADESGGANDAARPSAAAAVDGPDDQTESSGQAQNGERPGPSILFLFCNKAVCLIVY
eukprot:scaffold199122_cov18-Prasinocladus_malaysianus.AAC.1